MSRLYPFLLGALALVAATPAFAQLSAPQPLPGDSFRKPQQTAPAAPVAPPRATTARPAQPAAAPRGLAAVSSSPDPTYDEGTVDRINAALKTYAAIEARGGWPTLPSTAVKLAPGASGPDVAALRQRLVTSGDLRANGEADVYDETLAAAVKRFQARHGLTETGTIGPQTLAALNVPVAVRVRALTAS